MMDHLLTIPEAAGILRVHESTVYRMIRDGRMPGVHFGRTVRLTPTALESFVRAEEQRLHRGMATPTAYQNTGDGA